MKDADESSLSRLFIELSLQWIMQLYFSDTDQNQGYFHQLQESWSKEVLFDFSWV